MYICPWHFRAAFNIINNKGLNFLFHKSIRYVFLNGERRKHQWNSLRFLEDVNDNLLACMSEPSQKNQNTADTFLHREFMRNLRVYPGLHKEYIVTLLKSIKRRNLYHDFSDSAQDSLIELTSNLDPLSLPKTKWLGLHYLCLLNGLFKTAYLVRQKAIEKAYFDAENHRIGYLSAAFRAGIDQAEFEKARAYLDQLQKKDIKNSYNEFESYYYLNTGNLGAFRKIKEKKFDSRDQKFMNYIEGKSLAIVGPAPSDEEHGEEIDSFDIVVRFNYRGFGSLPDNKKFGKRTDMSYYNMPFIKEINEIKLNPFREIDFAVFKKIEYPIQENLIDAKKGRLRRKNYHFFNGTPLGGSHALYDILHFLPERVKLFNINFYLSKNPYYRGYSEKDFIKFIDTLNFLSFARHDMVSNINFTRNLWNAGLIEVDKCCEDVIRLPTYDYLSAMEKLFVQDFSIE